MRTTTLTLSLLAVLTGCSDSDSAPEPAPAVSGIDLTGFDESVRPQDDFNAYVNGGWIRDHEIPGDRSSWGSFDQLRQDSETNQRALIEELAARQDLEAGTDAQRVGDLFAAFMDAEQLEELGAAPLAGELERIDAATSIEELMEIGAQLRMEGMDSPLGLGVMPDLGDSSRYAVYLAQSGLTLPDRDYYLKDGEKYELVRSGLERYAQTLFKLTELDEAERRTQSVLSIENAIAEIHWPAEETRDIQKTYNPRQVAELDDVSSGLDWPGYLSASELASLSDVVVMQPSYVEGLGELLHTIDLNDWKSYFAFRLIDAAAPYLSDAFVQANFELSGRLVEGLEELPPRWQRGVRLTNALIGEAVGRLYVERHFPPAAKARMQALVGNLMAVFGEAIDGLEWMSDETKAKAQEKRALFTTKIGYPDEWRDYSALTIDRGDPVGNVRRGSKFEYDRNLAKLGGPIDRGEWGMTPQTVNAYHNPTLNEVVFPAAILQPPFFNLEADDAVNYGAIGVVIGHEIGHAFDDQGRKFGGDGSLRDWWTEEDAAAYEASAARLVEQYDAFEALDDLFVNGQLTLGENIGDLTGVTIAYRAYRKSLEGQEAPVIDGLSGDERFFYGYAQIWRGKARDEFIRQLVLSNPHSPPRFRVNGTLRNIPEFHALFATEEGDGMWLAPEERVKLW